MGKIKKLWGKILYGLGKGIDLSLGLIIKALNFILDKSKIISDSILGIIGLPALFMLVVLFFIGGPIIFLVFLGPLIAAFKPFFKWLFIIFILPIVSKYMLNIFDFVRYSLVEYLYDKSKHLIDGTSPRYKGLGDYAREFLRKKAEEKRRQEQERQEQARRDFERRFFGGSGGTYWTGGFTGGTGGTGNRNANYDFGGGSFKSKYEEACDTLGVDYNADENEIRSAYRNMAKKYHPDLNKSPGAKEKFQEINDANSFLSTENISRYKNLS